MKSLIEISEKIAENTKKIEAMPKEERRRMWRKKGNWSMRCWRRKP
jgi:hypothetical protein